MGQITTHVDGCRIARFYDRGDEKNRQVIAVIQTWGDSIEIPLCDPAMKAMFPEMKQGIAVIETNLQDCKKTWYDKDHKETRFYDSKGFFPGFLVDFKVSK